MVKEAMLYERLDNDLVCCHLCAHRCKIPPSKSGICGVRENRKGILYTLIYAEPIACHIDPVEKKPLYHFFPGTNSYSLATVGCNFKCGFCQNWQISQISEREVLIPAPELRPQEIVREAKESSSWSISYTYTEPTIFFEYAFDTAKLAKKEGLYNIFVTNGYMTEEALETISPYLDAANVDLKSFREDFYNKICKAKLSPVLDSIRLMKELNIWVEVTTLVIPGENDSDEELESIAQFIASVGENIPWHISRFHPDYRFQDRQPTSLSILKKAYRIGKNAGLRYVYLGNVLEGSDTFCYNCGTRLIKRGYLYTIESKIKEGRCPSCGADIDGVF